MAKFDETQAAFADSDFWMNHNCIKTGQQLFKDDTGVKTVRLLKGTISG